MTFLSRSRSPLLVIDTILEADLLAPGDVVISCGRPAAHSRFTVAHVSERVATVGGRRCVFADVTGTRPGETYTFAADRPVTIRSRYGAAPLTRRSARTIPVAGERAAMLVLITGSPAVRNDPARLQTCRDIIAGVRARDTYKRSDPAYASRFARRSCVCCGRAFTPVHFNNVVTCGHCDDI